MMVVYGIMLIESILRHFKLLQDHEQINFLRFLENKEMTIEIYKKEMPKWIDLGAKFVGGCCRIDSKDILEISKLLK
jgi:S-methylmethionine-dependent homocysteine/selenocysteine methylase